MVEKGLAGFQRARERAIERDRPATPAR
jgi:hypothetical protein